MRTPTTLLSALLLIGGIHGQKQPDLKKIDAYIADAVARFDQPGLAVGIVKDGKLVWSKGYGRLDLDKPDPVTPNSIFFTASLSKAFTSCAIGLLIDEGKLGWDDPVRTHLPEFSTPNPYVTANMTVRDLLCHRSGWSTFDGDLLWYGTELDQDEILRRHAGEPFTYGFRDKYGYSNLMYIAAARVIERVGGKSWDDFVTERILNPLGMARTTVETAALAGFTDVALPHVRKGQDPLAPQKSMPYQPLRGADGATGINSCVTDLAKWDAMWMNEGAVDGKPFLKRSTWTTITTEQLSREVRPEQVARGQNYSGVAMGWFTEDRRGNKIINHSGGMPGFILYHAVVPAKDLAVIALGNGESYCVFPVVNKVLDLYLGITNTDPVTDVLARQKANRERDAKRVADRAAARIMGTNPSAAPEALAATYADRIYGEAAVTEAGGSLRLTLLPAKDLLTGALEHWHHDTWKWNLADPFLEPGFITFIFDADHRVTGFRIDLYSPDFHFHKLDFKRK